MLQLNEHQSRLWHEMLKSIEDFRQGKVAYYDFVGALEAALDAGEFKQKNLVEKWYDYWTPLESVRAQKGNDVRVQDVSNYLFDLERFLKTIVREE